MADAVAALERVAGAEVAARVSFAVDDDIQAIVNAWPRETRSARAAELGFVGNDSIDEIVRAHIADELGGEI